ncbi:hypothetical protein RSSM_04631 [Rhodopirellula sallentina SM41]|uniref:Uncharacterized protein n=1 Tax=Rhodopirellula sallentina SM41 TaxID=1263870 RepID=M5TXY5_9BACT|nr:hypothetical protein RSSM_04631 [Rhodopirellula sallentina SM41]
MVVLGVTDLSGSVWQSDPGEAIPFSFSAQAGILVRMNEKSRCFEPSPTSFLRHRYGDWG